MVCGPEVARCANEFEATLPRNSQETSYQPFKHHEQTDGFQKRFRKHVTDLVCVFEEMGNPFLEVSPDLLVLDTHNIMVAIVVNTVNNIEKEGEQQYIEFANARLKGNQKSICEPIHMNKFPLFSSPHPRKVSSKKEETTTLKKSCHLFSQLYIACQVREGNLDAFFRHENQSYPPSISKNGDIRSGTKSDLLTCLEEVHLSTNQKPNIDVMILDGVAIVNMLRPGDKKTFADYASEVFIPYIER